IRHLVAREINWMIAAEFGVNALVKLSIAGIPDVQGFIASVIFGQLLLNDVGLDGNAEMIGLAGEIGRDVIVLILLKGGIAEIAPQNSGHAEFVSLGESVADLNDLAIALLRAEINGCANGSGAHVIGFLNSSEQDLVELVWISEQFIVIDLHDERNFVGIFAGDGAKHAKRGSHGVATAFDGQFDNVFAIKIVGVFREAGAAGMLDALIDGEDRHIARAGKTAGEEHPVEIVQHAKIAVGCRVHTIDEVGAGNMQPVLGNLGRLEAEKRFRLGAQVLFYGGKSC